MTTTPVAPAAGTPPATGTAAAGGVDAASFNQALSSAAMAMGTIVYGPVISGISGNPYYEAYEK
jgi:hypothetical protein